jgi:DNA (cytosine-5)-methyltransferase 1
MITAGDFLAGGGGVTEAMSKIPDLKVKFVLNHDKLAIRTNLFNHKGIKHFWADIYKQDEHEVEKVDFIWASIECTQHSRANGGREKKIGSYTLGWELVRYIKYIMPLAIGIENVPEFRDWAPMNEDGTHDKSKKGEEFQRWKNAIRALGYEYHELICNAADYGIPTRRVRYFAFFVQVELGLPIDWPKPTHSKTGKDGLKKWVACKSFINLENEGESIFGRKFNPKVKKGKRVPLVPNSLKRIAGGIKKYAPELSFIFQYYGNGLNAQSVNAPLNTVTTKDRHVLVTIGKKQFISDHCYSDNYNTPEDPLNPILTRETKQLVTVEKLQFLSDYYGRENTAHDLEGPANTITTENSKHLVTINKKFFSKYYSGDQHHAFSPDDPFCTIRTKDGTALIDINAQFIAAQYNSNGNPGANVKSLEDPLGCTGTEEKFQLISHHFTHGNNQSVNEPLNAITTKEKIQFITAYFSSSGNQQSQNQAIDDPLGTITTSGTHQALVSVFMNGDIDFDIRMRFLDPEELAQISTFPAGYFTNKQLGLTRKQQTKLIGNAVPPEWARLIIEPVVKALNEFIVSKQEAI